MASKTKYVVAVSGGVDSVALLHMLTTGNSPHSTSHIPLTNLIVAHFDHGIRIDSAADAKFVGELAKKYGLAFETKREELGKNASEELARDRRYAFLRDSAAKYDAKIMTAHHADDVIETIAINLIRGTGWRGLTVLDSNDIERPLLHSTKAELISYANQHSLEWREDSTNQDTKYLRNDVRRKLHNLDETSKELLRMYRDRQVFLRKEVDNESRKLVGASPYGRYLFTNVTDQAACELLREVLMRETGQGVTRPQLHRALHAIKVLPAGKRFEIADGMTIRCTKTDFVVEFTPRVLS